MKRFSDILPLYLISHRFVLVGSYKRLKILRMIQADDDFMTTRLFIKCQTWVKSLSNARWCRGNTIMQQSRIASSTVLSTIVPALETHILHPDPFDILQRLIKTFQDSLSFKSFTMLALARACLGIFSLFKQCLLGTKIHFQHKLKICLNF
ncbi:hypothetical protein RCL_jg24873.t1 [Rhizophagus clarus]|uniref:Uncharacterized protein n=1 Tax=Rhizophagus clarus TaxID=94130 RepID=A0A8H3LPU7_9GLOM|nr:hypothetical protein RCL_jg24873.t1 [Rhizophagus clarus]